ncbi:DUF6415 family natural product biosynthesis protein [Streptomyces sp. NPDC091212]|uniref:DUF6415 family natural product biosynthesis protein n=1 Tax=Streptomyces sp. NPDC091212 TaxID=3155191 RepID=UPI00341F268B
MSTVRMVAETGQVRPAPDPLTRPTRWNGDDATLQRVLTRLREPEVPDAVAGSDRIYDDLEAVLGVHAAPSQGEIEELTPRMRAALIPLSDDLLWESREASVREVTEVIGRVSALREKEAPTEFFAARAYLRRLALAALEVLDFLAQPPADPEPAGSPVRGCAQGAGLSRWSA